MARKHKKRRRSVLGRILGKLLGAVLILAALAALGLLLWRTYKVASGESTVTLDAETDEFIHQCILAHAEAEQGEARCTVEDHIVLGTRSEGSHFTVYAWVLCEEYSFEGEQIRLLSGSHMPAAITYKNVYGDNTMIEYYTPRDGNYYQEDIREHFPILLRQAAADSQRFIRRQEDACRAKAEEYFARAAEESEQIAAGQAEQAIKEEELSVLPPVNTPAPSVSVNFSSGTANRAAITALTNYYAADVRAAGYSSASFHSYADTAGTIEDYLIYDWQTGIWTGKAEDTWHVANLELNCASGEKHLVSLDVTNLNGSYAVTNVRDLTAEDQDAMIDTSLPCFLVSDTLIEEDRVFR